MMDQREPTRLRLKVPARVAPLINDQAPREQQLAAARGALPLSGRDLLTVLFLFCAGKDEELRRTAATTLKNLPVSALQPVLALADLDPHLLHLVARVRGHEPALAAQLIRHPGIREETLLQLARSSAPAVLELLADSDQVEQRFPRVLEALRQNPAAPAATETEAAAAEEADGEEELAEEEIDESNISKYQLSLSLSVAEKIKMGMTGDKEWRTLLIKDANKLVQGAVMKNPRITDPEIIAIARNKQSSDEMIRLILLNKDWLKLYEVKRALIWHPKTPLPKALRMIGFLTLKDLKELARSRNVQTVLATGARKELERRRKKS